MMKILIVVLSILLVLLGFVLSVLVMTKGWGLQPRSWPWIIGGALFSFVCTFASQILQARR